MLAILTLQPDRLVAQMADYRAELVGLRDKIANLREGLQLLTRKAAALEEELNGTLRIYDQTYDRIAESIAAARDEVVVVEDATDLAKLWRFLRSFLVDLLLTYGSSFLVDLLLNSGSYFW